MITKDSLYLRYAHNDLVKNKGVNAALFVIVTMSAFLMATGAMVMERSLGSVDALFAQAKPPHFLQMHKGGYDAEALVDFAEDHPEIESWLVEDMLGFDGSAISWRGQPERGAAGDFSASLIDNLFVTQNEGFDFLLDEAGAIPRPPPGQVYVPVGYQQDFELRAGDELQVRTSSGSLVLTIRGFIRDSQMASSLSSATRFLVSDEDFADLVTAGGGDREIIAEYRLTDTSKVSQFQRAYESDEALPKNGQAVTYQMIRLINAFSDGLVALALVFVSGLLMIIALLNLRFVIRGTLEDEVREIGVMKAIGLPHRTITSLHLSKYRVMALVGSLLGGGLAIIATRLLTRSVQVNYAAAPVGFMTFLVPALALLFVYLLVVAMCRGVLRAVRRIEVVGALVHGSTLNEKQSTRRAKSLARRARRTDLASGGGDINRRLALFDLRAEARQWVLIPIVFALATVLIILPTNLLTTFESPRFVTYMGAPQSDLRVDLQFSDDVDAAYRQMLSQMEGDDRLTAVRDFANLLFETPGEEGWENLRVEVGDYSGGTVEFFKGQTPGDGEIALSVMNAEQYDLTAGDEMTIRRSRDGPPEEVVVSGIYQDVTSGGRTAKMQGAVTGDAVGYVIYADTVADGDPGAIAREYSADFASATVIPMREYVQQTLSYITNAFRNAAILAGVFGLGVALLITSLFLKLRLTRERSKMGVLMAMGFSAREIGLQVRFKILLTVVVGTVLGILLAATAGEWFVGAVISKAGLGISSLNFIPNPWLVYLAYPLSLIAAGYAAAAALTSRLRNPDKSAWLRG